MALPRKVTAITRVASKVALRNVLLYAYRALTTMDGTSMRARAQ